MFNYTVWRLARRKRATEEGMCTICYIRPVAYSEEDHTVPITRCEPCREKSKRYNATIRERRNAV